MKKIHLPAIFFILFSISLTAQRVLVRAGAFELPLQGECLTEDQRIQIRHELEANIRMLQQQGKHDLNRSGNPVSFEFPLQWNIPTDAHAFYVIPSYADHDPAYPGFLEDYNCGDRTYDRNDGFDHKGTDYRLWPFQWNMMDAEAVKIVAAADGIIIGKYDGYDDRSCTWNSNQWNAVYLRHADGSRSWYGHMKKNSVTTKAIGESVVTGEYLGLVGSSGNSFNPHLHFEVYNDDDDLIDPYAGPCNLWNEESWWIDQHPYIDPAILRIQTHFTPPVINDCPMPAVINDQDEFEPGDSVYFAAHIRDQQNFHIGVITRMLPKECGDMN